VPNFRFDWTEKKQRVLASELGELCCGKELLEIVRMNVSNTKSWREFFALERADYNNPAEDQM
jgi:hypothetical protein